MSKSFDDFVATLDEDTILRITDIANSKSEPINFTFDNTGFNKLLTASGTHSLIMTLEIFRLYHDWLNS